MTDMQDQSHVEMLLQAARRRRKADGKITEKKLKIS
jgi:hypothetical protein